ncbi:Tetratricopeptide TPR_2 repeat protein [Verrucomicrobia bacterium]|nr:Tetratricopeptide TPR_2 repeat protein [Verrucomicrobiota bacterium]
MTGGLFAQAPRVEFPPLSPGCTVKQRVGLTDFEIIYSRPGVKERSIFGGIVPYGEVWRTGANASTKISFSTPVKLDGHEVPAGTYALYTIPGQSEWTIIISSKTNLNGAFGYNEKDDVVRFSAHPIDVQEQVDALTIDFSNIRDDSATLYLLWDKTLVPIRVDVDVASKVLPQIEAALKSPEKKSAGFYFNAANFYFNHGQDLKEALNMINAGLADKPPIAFELLYVKAEILAKQGDKEGALAAAKESRELIAKQDPHNSFVKMNDDLISTLH